MPGTFIFRPIEANLTHDTDWLGQMDPYCAYMINNKRVKGQICKDGGMHPIWTEATAVPIETDQPACVVELMDKDKVLPDDSIGTFVIDLNEVRNMGTVNRWYPIYHKNKPAGEILFEASFQPGVEYMPATEIKPVFVPTPQITQAQPVITETIITEKVIYEEPLTRTTNLETIQTNVPSQTYTSKISSHELPHTSSLEDPMYGKTVGVHGVAHTGGVMYTSGQHSHLGSQTYPSNMPLGENQLNQPLPEGQFNQPLESNLRSTPPMTQSNLQQGQGTLLNQGEQYSGLTRTGTGMTGGNVGLSQAQYQSYPGKINSYELPHASPLEDPMYGKTVGVQGVEHTGGTLYSSVQRSNLGSQSVQGTQLSQPLGSNQSLNQGNLQTGQNLNQGNLPGSQAFVEQGNLPGSQAFVEQRNLQGTQPGTI